MIAEDQLRSHAERILTSGVLGRSELMLRLFNFFVDRAPVARAPKEIEVALEVFGKRPDFDVAQDAVVRVYIHKLRRKLDEYYVGPGKDEKQRLVIPKGEYRFVFQDHSADSNVTEGEIEPPDPAIASEAEVELESLVANAAARNSTRRWLPWLLGIVGALLLANLLTVLLRPGVSRDSQALQTVRNNPVWARMLDDNLPIYIVVGDYYIFGELDANSTDVRRMIRDFNINSPLDLEQYLKNNPELAGRYMDMSLQYLPTAAAFALRNVMPVLEPNNKSARQVQVIMASTLTPAMVKSAHIIYIGLLSGMGVLREVVFSGSHFKIGESYDELLDLQTNRRYFSEEQVQLDSKSSYLDYGFFSTHTGVDGNELVVLAGTRDVALMHVAEALTDPAALQVLAHQTGANQNIEALYSVRALDRTNLGGDLLLTYRLKR